MEPRMESAAYFFDKAEECRGLAGTVVSRGDLVIAALLAFATRLEVKAIEAAIRENDAIRDCHPPPMGKPNGRA
jgi:hypothetical protein